MAVGVTGIVVMLIIPLPPALLDLLLTANITGALVILLVTMYALEPLEFSAFPSLLLVATLFRLALNVSSTRLILLHAYAGKVIESFGNFVVGGNYIVGMVVFVILVVIQFVVITNGAGRVAEVAARFTLDAMPGKQMSIDADLNAGLITEREARARRRSIEMEADFYGAMDGASKFVRGDAIAGVIIILVNILGGVAVGVLQLRMPVMEALARYALLTVGDGLVSQIPALLISTATGIIVTRAASESNFGEDLARQVLAQPRACAITAGLLVLFGMVPGLPKLPFFLVAGAIGAVAYALYGSEKAAKEEEAPEAQVPKGPENVMTLLPIDPLELEIGYGLIPLTEEASGGDLLGRVTATRRQLALDLGLVIPHIRIRDNIQLRPTEYGIKIKGIEIARGEVVPGRYLAMNPGNATEPLEGIETREPAFGLPALWIEESERDRAEMAGYTVVEPSAVIITHLTEVIKSHADEVLGKQDVQNLLDNVKKTHPAVVDDLVPNLLSVGEVQKVLMSLLRERISIRDLPTILEALGDAARVTRDLTGLVEAARAALGRAICKQFSGPSGELVVLTIDPKIEDMIADSITEGPGGMKVAALEPKTAQAFIRSLAKEVENMARSGNTPVVLARPLTRSYVRQLIERALPDVVVLSFGEVVPDQKVRTVGMVRINEG